MSHTAVYPKQQQVQCFALSWSSEKSMNLVKLRKPAQPPQPLLEVRERYHWIRSLAKAVAEVDTVPGYVQYYSGGCPRTSVHSGSRTRAQVTLSLEQLYRNTFSQKTKPLRVLKREKENNYLCIRIILLFSNTFIKYFQQNKPFFHVFSSRSSFLRTSQAAVTWGLPDLVWNRILPDHSEMVKS